MRKTIPVKSTFTLEIQSTPAGATLLIGGIVVADIQGSNAVVTNFRNTVGTMTIHASLGQLIEVLAGQWAMEQSGWNTPSPGNEVEKEEVEAAEQSPRPTPPGLMARATDSFKQAFDWMMG